MTANVKPSATGITSTDGPEWESFSGRRPWLGIGLLTASIVVTLSVMIFFGAWFADDRIDSRAAASGHEAETADGKWWEDGLIAVCPLH